MEKEKAVLKKETKIKIRILMTLQLIQNKRGLLENLGILHNCKLYSFYSFAL